jgi:DNA-binding PadR family transcriptional regulator
MDDHLSGGELAVLTLLAEAPRHGYEIERLIAERGFREWTTIAFSSIYFLLGRLEKRGLVAPTSQENGGQRSRRPFAITQAGSERLQEDAMRAVAQPQRLYPELLLGMANWPTLEEGKGVEALASRAAALRAEAERLKAIRHARPLPDFVQAMFDYALGQIAADLKWTETVGMKLEPTMEKIDFKKNLKQLYNPPADAFVAIEVPEMQFVKVDGEGDPNTSPVYRSAVEWLYGVSYAMKFAAKAALGKDYVVPPLEGLWWADDPQSFITRGKDRWSWIMMIMVPDFITRDMFNGAVAKTGKKLGQAPQSLRLEPYAEGLSLQTLHSGSYDAEGPVLARLRDEVMPKMGMAFNGLHHEIYLSDPRKTEPGKLKTILRQPVKRNG